MLDLGGDLGSLTSAHGSPPPPAPPRWIGTRGLACVTIGALACAIPGPFLGRETALAGWGVSAVMFAAAALGARAIVSGEANTGVPYRRAVAIGALYGAVAGFAALSIAAAAMRGPFRFDMVVIVGSTLGPLGGIAVMIATLPLTVAARDWRVARPLDTFDRALGIHALVLALCLPSAGLASLSGERGWDGVVASILAATGLGWLALRDHARRRWLARVAAGEAPGYALDDATPEDAALPLLVRAAPGAKVLTLAAAAVADGPFRAGSAPVARLAQVDPARARRWLGVRAGLAAAAAVVLVAAQPPLVVVRAVHTNHTYQREPNEPTPVRALDGVAVKDVAVGHGYACAILPDGSMRCWGNAAGLVLVGDSRPTREPEAKEGIDHVRAMAIGYSRACILHETPESAAVCWGARDLGVLDERARLPPRETGPRGVAEIAMGEKLTLARTLDGKIHRWGTDLGDALVVEGLPAAKHVAAGGDHACVIDDTGAVWCWGANDRGAVTGARSTQETRPIDPTRVEALPGPVERLALASNTTWARVRLPDGRAQWWSWGARLVGGPHQKEEPAWEDMAPRPVPDTESFRELVVGSDHACALNDDGAVTCWGAVGMPNGPTTVLPPGSAEQLAGADTNHCARGKTRVWCWTSAWHWGE